MEADIKGVISPVLTPIADDGSLARNHITESVEFTLKCGCHAAVAAGTGVQETAMLTPEERKTLIAETVEAIDDRVPVLAGISHPAQPVVDELIAFAESQDVDAHLAMPPWGVRPDDDAVVRYYESIVDAATLPVLVYNNPSVAFDMPKEVMQEVAGLDGIDYIKESSRDWLKIGWLLEHVQQEGRAEVFTTMDVLLPTLQAGGVGGIIPAPASYPCMQIYEAYQRGDLQTATETQRQFGTFPPKEVDTGLTAVCKAAANLRGCEVGPPRIPYSPVSADGVAAIEVWLEEVGVPKI